MKGRQVRHDEILADVGALRMLGAGRAGGGVAAEFAYEIHHNQHRPHRSLNSAAPLKPLPVPVDLDQYRIRRQTRTACLINEYRLVA
jgi:hypothetical protein